MKTGLGGVGRAGEVETCRSQTDQLASLTESVSYRSLRGPVPKNNGGSVLRNNI